jgi:hypothetical protein
VVPLPHLVGCAADYPYVNYYVAKRTTKEEDDTPTGQRLGKLTGKNDTWS